MKLSQLKALLPTLQMIKFQTENGSKVPQHFHITEMAMITKHFIDCGGTVRQEQFVNFQIWYSEDFDHRLEPNKLLKIIEIAEQRLKVEDVEIEVEYQSDTIGKYGLSFDGDSFILKNKTTDCLAMDKCGVPLEKVKVNLADLKVVQNSDCIPGSACCSQ